jgi:hypothetical protein
MNLFGKEPESQPSAEELTAGVPPKIQISLSAEQKEILDQPVDPRVDKILKKQILRKLYGDRAAAEKALKAGETSGDGANRRVVQDANGFWRITDGPESDGEANLLGGL